MIMILSWSTPTSISMSFLSSFTTSVSLTRRVFFRKVRSGIIPCLVILLFIIFLTHPCWTLPREWRRSVWHIFTPGFAYTCILNCSFVFFCRSRKGNWIFNLVCQILRESLTRRQNLRKLMHQIITYWTSILEKLNLFGNQAHRILFLIKSTLYCRYYFCQILIYVLAWVYSNIGTSRFLRDLLDHTATSPYYLSY